MIRVNSTKIGDAPIKAGIGVTRDAVKKFLGMARAGVIQMTDSESTLTNCNHLE